MTNIDCIKQTIITSVSFDENEKREMCVLGGGIPCMLSHSKLS